MNATSASEDTAGDERADDVFEVRQGDTLPPSYLSEPDRCPGFVNRNVKKRP